MKIPEKLIPDAYNVAKKVYDKKLSMSDGARFLVNKHEMNLSSARDYIYDFKYLIEAKRFTRKLNKASMGYFFEHILTDYGIPGLTNALLALKKHIEYNENRKEPIQAMKVIYAKYLEKLSTPSLISNREQLLQNIDTIETYLTEGNDEERLYASLLIKRGTCFIAYKIKNELRFAPSRFLGYINNKFHKYLTAIVDGRHTNKAIWSILKAPPEANKTLETKYYDYCKKLGIVPSSKGGAYGVQRKFWTLSLETDFHNNNELTGEFPEGKIVERTHKARERNSQVVEMAKSNFKKKYGKLFCQVCDFDFEKTYGEIGKDFIEGHHTIAVSEMPPDYKTKPEEIAMLCANCHRIVHKKRPWLTMSVIKNLLT